MISSVSLMKNLKIPFKRFLVIVNELKHRYDIWINNLFLLVFCLLTCTWAFSICLWSTLLYLTEGLAGNMCRLWTMWKEGKRMKKNPKLMGNDLSFLSVSVILYDTICLCVGLKIHNTERLTFLYYLKCLETFRKFQFWEFILIKVLS